MRLLAALGLTACGAPRNGEHPVEVQSDECTACHLEDYESAADPVHVDPLSTDCAMCHDQEAWQPAPSFEHVWWPLSGAHVTLASCAGCHAEDAWRYAGTPQDCADCHLDDYEAATEPVHVAPLTTDCSSCHNDEAFQPAPLFVHDGWELEGAHEAAACAGCHAQDEWAFDEATQECIACHLEEYQSAPSHVATRFSETCNESGCHTMDAFSDIEGGHPYDVFPLGGVHAGYSCDECHNQDIRENNGKANVDCTGCHDNAHLRSAMDPFHEERLARYLEADDGDPNFCLECHAAGLAERHPEDRFTLVDNPNHTVPGAQRCETCHRTTVLGQFNRDNTTCVQTGCHVPEAYNAYPPHEPLFEFFPDGNAEPNFCLDCHPNGT